MMPQLVMHNLKKAWRLKSRLYEQDLPSQVKESSSLQSAQADFVCIAAISIAKAIVKFFK